MNRIDFGSVIALTFAAEGAMGEAGGIEFSTADGSLYHLNYIRGPVAIQQFHRAFPSSPSNIPDLPGYWHELYLGVGSCLYIHDQAYKKYMEGSDLTDPRRRHDLVALHFGKAPADETGTPRMACG